MLVKCLECGKFFGSDAENTICSSCKEGELTGLKHIKDPKEQRFIVARNLVYENPDISPENLVKIMTDRGIDISIKDVMTYVRQGRLTLKSIEAQNICEDCGKKILSGRKCPSCTKKFEEELSMNKVDVQFEARKKDGEDPRDGKRKTRMHTRS